MTMKNISSHTLTSAGTVIAALLTVCVEMWISSSVRTLKNSIAEHEAMTEQYIVREKFLIEQIRTLSEEKVRIDELPLVLSQSEDDLKAVIEQCAAAAGVLCGVSEQAAADGNAGLLVSGRFFDGELKCFLAELLARREFFIIDRIEYDGFDDFSAGAVIYLSSFLKKETR